MHINSTFRKLREKLERNRQECLYIDKWMSPDAVGFPLPTDASQEHHDLALLSKTPWLKLVVDSVAQSMWVDRITTGDDKGLDSSYFRHLWNINRLEELQPAIHRAVAAYGRAYGVVTPTDAEPRIRVLSPDRCAVEFNDPLDAYPKFALEALGGGRFTLFTAEVIYELEQDSWGADPVIVTTTENEIGVCPVVEISNVRNLSGGTTGEVTPYIPIAQRINKTVYDTLLVQHFNSFKVKYLIGAEPTEAEDEFGDILDGVIDEEAWQRAKDELRHDSFLMTTNESARFGTLDETSLAPFATMLQTSLETLAAVSQTPVYALTGQLVNLSADALAAARGPLVQKIYERQQTVGSAYAKLLRLGAALDGEVDYAEDYSTRVTWRDVEIRSLTQAADAAVKLANILPIQALWDLLPQAEASDKEAWGALLQAERDADPTAALYEHMSQATKRIEGD